MFENNEKQTPPHSLEAEEGVLASCLVVGSEVVAGCVGMGLKAECFYRPANGHLWTTMLGLYDRKEEIDDLTVGAVLESLGQLTDFGGYPELNRISSRVETSIKWRAYASIVLDRDLQRRAHRLSMGVREAAMKPAHDFKELTERVQPLLTELGELSLVDKGETLKAVALDQVLAAEKLARGEKTPESTQGVIGTPWAHFNETFLPFDPNTSGLTVIGARPGCGKTSFCLNILRHALLRQGMTVVTFSLEMSREQFLKVMASQEAQVNLQELDQEPRDKLARYVQAHKTWADLSDDRLFIFDSDYTIEAIEARLRFLKQRLGQIHLVVVDYLQLIESSDKGKWSQREAEVAKISRRLKLLQKELGCVFMVPSQINRESEKGDREPKLADLRESGAIEQDADRVLLLHKLKIDHLGNAQQEGRRELVMYFIQPKWRYGPKPKSRFLFRQVCTTFLDFPGSKKPSDRPAEKRAKKVEKQDQF